MPMLLLICLLVGAVLAQRFTVLVLIPATALAVTAAAAIMHTVIFWQVLGLAVAEPRLASKLADLYCWPRRPPCDDFGPLPSQINADFHSCRRYKTSRNPTQRSELGQS